MKRILFLSMAICMLMSCFCTSFAKSFADVPSTHWSFKYVDALSNGGVINGYEDGSFKPDNNVTKAEFMKLVLVAEEGEKTFEFYPNTDPWYLKYFWEASDKGYITETVNEETGNEPITRKEIVEILALMVWKHQSINIDLSNIDPEIAKQMEIYDKLDEKAKLTIKYEGKAPFSDCDEFDELGVIDLCAVVEAGLITGYEDGTFRPDNNLTRAEVSTIVYRVSQKMGGWIKL